MGFQEESIQVTLFPSTKKVTELLGVTLFQNVFCSELCYLSCVSSPPPSAVKQTGAKIPQGDRAGGAKAESRAICG